MIIIASALCCSQFIGFMIIPFGGYFLKANLRFVCVSSTSYCAIRLSLWPIYFFFLNLVPVIILFYIMDITSLKIKQKHTFLKLCFVLSTVIFFSECKWIFFLHSIRQISLISHSDKCRVIVYSHIITLNDIFFPLIFFIFYIR